MNVRRLKPSGTVLVAAVALMVGLEAPAMAHQVNVVAHKISGSSIKEHSVAGNRLKNNTVTGKQVKESTLTTVPRASVAAKADALPRLVWHPITNLLHGWQSGHVSTSEYRAPAYAVDAQGTVHLQGTLDNGTAGAVAFTLPAADLPLSGTNVFEPMIGSGGAPELLEITSEGVAPSIGPGGGANLTGLSVLEGIEFAPR